MLAVVASLNINRLYPTSVALLLKAKYQVPESTPEIALLILEKST